MKLKNLMYIMLLLALSMVIVACSNDKEEADKPKEEDKTETTDTEKEDDAEVEEGGELQVAVPAQPPTLDVVTTTATAARDISQHIYEALVTYNTKFEVQPMLAETYEISEDGKMVTFNLREGIKFHNGDDLTAEDVVASMERWQSLSSSAKTFLDGTTYEATDEKTVVAHIVKPSTLDMFIFADMTQFAAIMPKSIIDAAGAEGTKDFIGTGPYKFEEWKQDQYIHLKKYDDFVSRTDAPDGLAGEKKAISSDIYFNFLTDPSTRVAGLMSEEYDIATAIPQDNVKQLDSNDDLKTKIIPSALLVAMFNNKQGAFTDKKMRQAVNAAIDVDAVLLAAYSKEEFFVKDHALVKDKESGWYTDEGSEEYNLYDPEKSKKLLKEAGYNGEEIVLLTIREFASFYNSAVVIQQQLEAVGINLKLDVRDAASALELTKDENAWDIWMDEFAFRPLPVQQLFLNPEYMGWPNSPALADVKDKILYSSTLEEAQEFSPEFHKIFWDEVTTIKVGNNTNVTGMQEGVEGYQFISGPILWNVSTGK